MHELPINTPPYPLAIGNELEHGIMYGIDGKYDEPYNLAAHMYGHLPKNIIAADQFLSNGFRLYAGGARDCDPPTNIEIATPECASPTETVRYIRAGEAMLKMIGSSFLTDMAWQEQLPVDLRIHRRVVDAYGNAKGCHDNFGLEDKDARVDDDLKSFLISYLQSRSFISGAGFVRHDGYRFAQKIEYTNDIEGYGYFGRMLRFDESRDSMRLEIGCSDVNVSDWAALMRVGGTALALAVFNTPAYADFKTYVDEYFETGVSALDTALNMNRPKTARDGTLFPTDAIWMAVEFQKRLAELALDKLQLYADLPTEYYKIANEIYNYIEDFETVMDGGADVALLADRADWAAKLAIIKSGIQKDQRFGIPRSIIDFNSQAQDLRYDLTHIIKQPDDHNPTVILGSGMKLRERGHFKSTVTEKQIAEAVIRPPQTTRAKNRGDLIKDYQIEHVDWDEIDIKTEDGGTHSILLEHVNSTDIEPKMKYVYPVFKRRKG